VPQGAAEGGAALASLRDGVNLTRAMLTQVLAFVFIIELAFPLTL
jgi:hypothetical protein